MRPRVETPARKPGATVWALRNRCLVGQAMALALWNAPAFAQNVITTDGRTQTAIAVEGATTTITTKTIAGGAGYNSFARFEQGAGSTVNMHLPQNTGALVNIVRNGPVVVNGILNSYRNGSIGGHVYFSDSSGFTVGQSGVINTGRLTVNTPTRDFLDGVISPGGVVNETLAARLRANDVPISPDGAISIEGRINARQGVTLHGHSVSVSGQITANAASVDVGERRRRHQTAFAASVNTSGVRHGGAMVARRGGGIEIVAAGTARISGTFSANASGRRSAGTITVHSGKGTVIASTARFSAQGAAPSPRVTAGTSGAAVNTGDGGKVSLTSDATIAIARGAQFEVSAAQSAAGKGGEIKILAGTDLDVESGAIFRGKGGLTGDGGFTELSARQTVRLGAIDADLSARSGKAGLLYIDPTDLIIGTGGSASMITNGTNVSLEASNSITIAADGIIDTRRFDRNANGGVLSAANPSTGDSGSILLTAPNIAVYGSLLAGVSTGSAFAAGDVTLDATTSDIRIAGMATATSTIDIHGTITGRDVALKADATAVASYADISAGSLGALAAQSVGGALLGLNGGYVGSRVLSRIRVVDGATIEATNDVTISAKARQEATMPAVTVSGVNPFAVSVSIGEIFGTVTADVAQGATIKVGRNLAVTAENNVKLGVSAVAISVSTALVAATVAYGYVDVSTAAKIHSGATIQAGSSAGTGAVSVTAKNTNSFSTSATAIAAAGGIAGISVAYGDYKTEADALLGASLGTSANKVGNVTVQALSDTTKNATSASATAGNNQFFNAGPAGSTVSDLLSKLFGGLSNASSGVPVKVGSAVTIASSNLSASAAIAADAGGTAPTIHASGDVVVASRQRDFGIRMIADSSTNSNSKDPTGANPEAEISLAFGIAVGNYSHSSTASIGSGVQINAGRIGVAGLSENPISNTWTNWAGLGEVFSHLNGNLGIVNNILTSYANSSASAAELGLAGAVDYFRVSSDTSAYVGSGATLNQTTGMGSWSTNLANSYTQQWSSSVSIVADTDQHSIDVGGNFGFTGGINGGAGSAVGGSLLDIGRSSRTVAAVAAGATINATDLSVTANTSDKMFVIATTSGRSAGTIALTGMVSLAGIHNQTLASISNAATITANSVSVKADQFLSVFALSGALTIGGGSGIGISVGVMDAGTITRAYVGDNSGDLSDGRLAGVAPQGLITTGSIAVEATTTGRVTAASVAAAAADGAVAISLPPGTSEVVRDLAATFAKQTSGGPSLSAAGTAAVALTTMGTSAWIDGARLQEKTGAGLATSVRALNSTIIEVGAGAAAANLAGTSGASGAIAGAVAIGIFDNSTDSRISGSSLTGVYDTSVQAVAGGRATIVGVSLAASAGGNGAAAISAAVGLVTGRTSALIANSALTATAGLSTAQVASVNAYQTTDIGIGGGAAYLGAQSGIGLALTYASIGDPSGEDAVSARIRNSSLVNLDGLNVVASNSSRIVSGAATAGLGGNGLSGAFVFNKVKTSTRAEIGGAAGAPPAITVIGNVILTADSSRDATFDAIIAGRQSFAQADASQVEFTGAVANGGDPNPNGAAILAIAGAVQIGRDNAGISFLSNEVAQSHIATIDNVILTATGDVRIRAQDGASITGVAVGLGGATGQFAGVASVALQSIDNVVRAGMTGTGTIVTAYDILLNGSATSTIRGSAGSLGLGFGAAALGLSVVENAIANTVATTVEDARLRASRDVALQSRSTGTISTLAVGIAISRNVGLAGSVANSSVETDVSATVKRADIIAENNVGVIAANKDGIAVSAGALGVTVGAPSVAGGLSVVNNTIGGSTTASIGENSAVDARVNGTSSLVVSSGGLVSAPDLVAPTGPSTTLPDLAMATRNVRGLAVIATSQQAVMANAVTAGIAVFPISGAVGYVTIRNDLGGETLASIDSSAIDTRLNAGPNPTAVVVDAASHSYAGSYIVVGAIGGAAGAGADANTTMKRRTSGSLTNSTTGTIASSQAGAGVGAVQVTAVASQASTGQTIGFAFGFGGAAATGLVNSFEAVTTANVDQGLLNAASLLVKADSSTGFHGGAGVGAGAAGVALGSAFVVARSNTTTLATIGGGANITTLNLAGTLNVLATSTNRFSALAAGGSAGGGAAVAGMVNLIDVANTTRAGLYGVASTQRRTLAQELAGVTIDGSLNIIARETTAITPTTGSAAYSGGGYGAGAAINVASLDGSVLADLANSTVSTPGAVVVQSVSDRNVDAEAFTVGVGATAGLGAAVNVISVGAGAPAGADLNIGGDGTLSRVNQLTAVDPGLLLSTSGLATYRTLRGPYASGATDEQLRATANAEYLALIQNGTVVNGVLTLTDSGVQALRSNATISLFQGTPATDQQVRDYAAARYTALKAANLQYVIGDAGLSSYREIVHATTPSASDAQVRIAADDAFAALMANGAAANGVYMLRGSSQSVYQAAADAELGRTATVSEVSSYAASQYAWFVGNRARTATPTAISATALLDSSGAQTGATALGGAITASSVSVTSTSRTSTDNTALGIGVGGVGVGAALGYTTVADVVSARLDQMTVTTGSITVNASATDGAAGAASRIAVEAGAGSGAAAAGAAVAQGSVSNTLSARLGGTLNVTGAISVSASTTQGSRADALGAAAAGGGALGVSLASSSLSGTATADLAANATLSGGSSLSVTASSNGISYASSTAGAGGLLLAGVGADASASDTSRVEAHLGDNASVNVGTGAITVSATATPDAKAAAYGVSVTGGLAVGVAYSRATANQTVIAAMDGGAAAQRALTAGSLSILATSAVFGTPVTSIGGSPGKTDQFNRGGTGAAAWSFAGSGAYYASAVGSDAGASTTSTVTASAGNNVRLPNGVVAITASNTTRQIASSTGFSIAGKYSVGAVLADARSTATTSATLGADARMAGGGTSSFSLTATGSDTQIAKAVSGSGGLIAGAGAQADTANTATVTARVGARAQISANTILVNAQHTDAYANLVDATQAAALGASASLASHNALSNVLVDIGNTVTFAAAGTGTRGCFVTSCVQGIELESRNIFTRLALGDTISAGAGGGINGVGAKSTIGIDGTSKVLLGNDVVFASGGNAVNSPGPIAIQAITELTADDTATLTTGGLLQGAGVTSQYRADVDNEVTLGTSNTLTSAGAINIGTYTTATVKTNALVTTYGLAAVGVAEADTNIRTDQIISIGANTTLTGLDNVNVTAGRDASGIATTSINGDATAVGYVRGLIAVPDADAATDLQNHARLNVATGAALLSAQNVTLGAYNGTVTPNARGAGHGFQLYFIPVTQRDESPGSAATSTVVMNGRAVGGVFREQDIVIGCGANGASICGLNERPTVYIKAGGAPVTVTFDESFNAVRYVQDNYTTYTGTLPDTTVADTLVGGIAPGNLWAYRISQLYAAGGNVYVNGDTIQGNGSLTANGGPTISVKNNSAAYLVLDGGAYIPDLSTGQILFTGGAQGQNGLAQSRVNADGTASIIINNAYTRDDIGNYGPALLIAGDVTNLGGLVSINNTQGSFGFSGQRIDALQFNVTVPNGAVAISSNGPNGMYNAGASPQAEWNHALTYPGATPGQPSQNFSVVDTVNAIANTLYFGSYSTLNYNLYHRIDDGGDPAKRVSTIFYGNCIGYGSTGYNCGSTGYTYQGRTFGRYDFGNGIDFVTIPNVPKYYESNSVQAQGSGSQIYGAQVAIKASVININASIEAGRVTNRSVSIEQATADTLEASRNAYLDAGYRTVSMTDLFPDEPYWKSATTVQVSYDFVNRKFIVEDTNASSGGGSVLLDGQIISTNPLGKIKINGGFGHVTVNNNTDRELVVNRINTGTAAGANASTSKITIVDRLKPADANTTVYVYTPGSGIAEYRTSDGAQPILSGANASAPVRFTAGDATSYDVRNGTRYEWTQQLFVYKDDLVSGDPNKQGTWRYSSGSSNNPWEYVPAPATGIWGDNTSSGPDYWNTSTTPQGRVTYNEYHAISNPVFFETLQGGVIEVSNAMQTYGNCNGRAISHCDRDFVGNSGSTANTYWNYNHVRSAWLQVTASVRADYDFGISFAGNASGLVTINSNAAIRQQGNIVNPSGATTITANAGSFTQAPNVSILSNHLTITARNSVGTADATIQATLTAGAAIAAYSGAGGIYIDLDSDAKIWRLNADRDAGSGRYGDIRLRATGGLEVANWAPSDYTHALGNNITISSRDGAVGGINTPLRIQAMATTLANGSQTGGVVNISAQGDIGIRQLSGNLRVGQIASTGGNVRVDVAGGTLKAANAQTAAQSLSTEQLSAISGKLKLTQADGADAAAQASVAAFERSVTQTYGLYASLIRNGSVIDGVFTLDAAAEALYQPLATAAGMTVEAYVADRYANYASVFERAYGANWSTQARFQEPTLESNFSFTTASPGAASGLASSITANAVWQTGQLVAAIDQAALQPASGVVGNGTPIILGRDVTLNIGGSIGSLAADVAVSLDAIRNGTLSTTELQALAVATTPGSVKLVGTNGAGQRVNVASLGTVPDGVTLTSIDIAQTAPLFVSATGTFSGSAQGDIYLQATTVGQSGGGSLHLGRVTATGQINLQAPQAITVATAQNSTTPLNAVQIQAGTDLTLSAAGGGIGSAATPLTYQIGGRLISASAGAGDAYLVKPTGNVDIGRIFAQGTVSLTAGAGSISGYLPGVAISAQNVVLNASGNVGSQATPFAVQSASDGEISGQIGGSGWISTPTLATQTAIAQRIGALTAAGSLTLTADAELRILRSLSATTGALAAAAGSIVMQTGATATAAGRVTLASASDITLGRVGSALVAPQGTASIAVTAAGAIFGNTGVVNLDAAQAGGVIALNAGNGIGSTLAAVSFAAPRLSARSLQGNVNLRTASSSRITSLTVDAGAATISAGGALTIDALTSGGAANATSSASTLTVTALTAGGTATLTAAGLVTIGGATTNAGNLVIASTAAGITAATLTAAGTAGLTAQGAIAVTTSLNSGRGATVSSTGGTLDLAALTAGGATTLSGAGTVTIGSAGTTSGNLSVTSLNGGIGATTLTAADALTLAAPGAIIVATATSGAATQATSSTSTLAITALTSAQAATLAGRDGVTLGSVTTTAGTLTATSSHAGITAAILDAGGAASLTAAGAIAVTTSLTSGGGASVTSTGSTLNLIALTAGSATTLTGWGAVTLGSARTTGGDLAVASSTAGITAATLDAAALLTLTAPGAINVTTATSGGAASAASTGSTLSVTMLSAGGTATLDAAGLVAIGSATTTAGNIVVGSSTAGITAATLNAAGATSLTAPGAISVTTSLTSGDGATVTSTGSTLNLVALTSGGTTTLSGSGAVTLGSARTTSGDLSVSSLAAGIDAATLTASVSLTLNAPGAIGVTTATSGTTTQATSSADTLAITALTAGGTATLSGHGGVTLGGATTTAGDLTIASSHAGITAATLNAAGAASLTAAGAIAVTISLVSDGGATVSSTGSTLNLVALTAGGATTLSGSGAVTLGSARTTGGGLSVTSLSAGIAAATLDAATTLSLDAPGAIGVTTATSGATTQATSSADTLSIGALTAGGAATLAGRNGVTLTSATTALGDLAISSSHAGITAATLSAGGTAGLTAAGAIAVTTSMTSGGAATATSTGSTLTLAALTAGPATTLSGSGAVTIGSARTTGGGLSVSSLTAGITATTLDTATALSLTAPGTIGVTTATSGGATQATSTAGSLDLTTLTAGATSRLSAAGAVTLGSATTTAGDLSVTSTGSGIAATTVAVAGAATIDAAGAIVVATLSSGGTSGVASSSSTITITSLEAGSTATLGAAGQITLGQARTMAGDLIASSTAGGLVGTILTAAGAADLGALQDIAVTSLSSGGTSDVRSSAGAIDVATLSAGATTQVTGASAVALGTAITAAGDLRVRSGGTITAGSLTGALGVETTAAGAIGIGTLTSGAVTTATSTAGALRIDTLSSGQTATLAAATGITLDSAATLTGDLIADSAAGIQGRSLIAADRLLLTARDLIALAETTSGAQSSVISTAGIVRAATLRSGATATIEGAGGIDVGSILTAAGDIVLRSAGASLTAGRIEAANAISIAARGDIVIATGIGAGRIDAASSAGGFAATSLLAGDAMTVSAAGLVDIATARTMLGAVRLTSAAGGLAIGGIVAQSDISLLARETIAAGSLTAGRDLAATSQASSLNLQSFSAMRDIRLSANGAIALETADAGRDLAVVSGAGVVTVQSARADGAVGIEAAGLITVTALRSGGATTLSGGALSIGAVVVGEAATLQGAGLVRLGTISTLRGDLTVASSNGQIDATALDTAGGLALQAGSSIQVGAARSAGAARFVSTGGAVAVGRLSAGSDATLVADGAASLTDGNVGRMLTLNSARGLVSVGTAIAGSDIEISAQSIVFGALDAGRDARLSSAGSIDGDGIVATQTLSALAGATGAGSIAISVGAARNSAFTAPDEVRLGRYGAGDSIVILGNTIVSNIVQLAGGSGAPLSLTVAGSRQRTAERVALSVDAARFRTTRLETVNGTLTTTSRRFDLLQTFVPGMLRLDAPGLRIVANNLSPAPLNGFDLQLFQRDRPFFISVNGSSLTTNATIIRFDSDVIDIPGGNGGEPEVSMARDLPRMGASMMTGPSFGETARGFVLDETGRWRSVDPETTASIGGGVSTRVNLAGGGEQP